MGEEIEITEMEITNLAVTEMSNLVIVKEVIVRVATDLMTRKDSTTENQVALFHLAIASSRIKNFRYKNYYIQSPIQEPNFSKSETLSATMSNHCLQRSRFQICSIHLCT